jgi:hypothetical protein
MMKAKQSGSVAYTNNKQYHVQHTNSVSPMVMLPLASAGPMPPLSNGANPFTFTYINNITQHQKAVCTRV